MSLFRKRVKEKYTFIKARLKQYPVAAMSRAKSIVGHRFYLCSNPRGLVVPDNRAGSILTASSGLEHEE
jgi:hypothetical protein